MHTRVERFLAHIHGVGGIPPTLCLWRDEMYLGAWDIAPQDWMIELFTPGVGEEFAMKVVRQHINRQRATACLAACLDEDHSIAVSYYTPGTYETWVNGKQSKRSVLPKGIL